MVRQQEMGAPTHADPALEVDAARREGVVLLEELVDVQHDTVAEQASLAGMQDPRGDLVEDELLLPHVNGVARVGATLVASHDVDVLGENVHDLAFALVAPLAADDDRASTAFRHDPRTQKKPVPWGQATLASGSFGGI